MYKYVCENESCGWTGDSEEVDWVYAYEFLGLEEPEDEEDIESFERICVCPKCEIYTMTYEIKI